MCYLISGLPGAVHPGQKTRMCWRHISYQDLGFTVLSVSIDEADHREKWLKAIEQDSMSWPQLSDLKGNDNVPYNKLYGITTIPANVLIDPSGKVIGKDLKREDLQAKLASLFK